MFLPGHSLTSRGIGALSILLLSVGTATVSAQEEPVNVYGALDSPIYPFYIQDQGVSAPAWTSNTTEWFDPDKMPISNQTRKYDFTISRGIASPDGYEKHVMLVNGQFPGPMIEANWGDWIEVTIHNKISNPVEGTAMHWHGILQKDKPWMDGVPSVSQCPIAPGETYTYRFRADRFGFSWYHSHYSAQYAGGLLGPMLIHGPSHARYDIDLGPVFITDWYHREYFDIIKGIMSTNTALWDLSSQSNLINGKGQYNCSKVTDGTPCDPAKAKNALFSFKSGKTHLLRLINAGAEGFEYFSIDGHQMTVIANDFTPIEPYNTTVVALGVGQRADVLVQGTGRPEDSFWMRANNSYICGQTEVGEALAEIRYEKADLTKAPTSEAQPFIDPGTCTDDPLNNTIPYFAVQGVASPDTTIVYNINKTINSTGNQEWQVNDSAFRGNYNQPLMLLTQHGNTSYPDDPEWNVYNFGKNKTVRMILNNISPFSTRLSHPMHLHGHDFNVISEGVGRWDGTDSVRPTNPMRRDTVMLPRGGYVVIDVVMNNPGVWPFHCHIAWHVSEGLYINIMDQPDRFRSKDISEAIAQTCTAWNEYTSNNVVEQIDSGLRMMEKERSVPVA